MAIADLKTLPPELVAIQREIEDHARRHGLDFFPVCFELVDADQMNAIAAYGGFPTRYPHWRFGMEYEQLSRSYTYGLSKIYELVINNDPCYAYLMTSNEATDQKMVMAHVYGHCDFFKNNLWFAPTNRKMVDQMANHGNRIRRYMDRFGVEPVEQFIDACLSVEDLIDIHSPHIKRYDPQELRPRGHVPADEPDDEPESGRFETKPYLDRYVNPPETLAAERTARQQKQADPRFPREPVRDVMLFLLENAPLRTWQLDVLSILREEAYYFAPQAQTKIMNEGWASYWHSKIMTRHGLSAADLVCYCDHHSGTLATAPGRLNPYKLGIELFRDIEERWNTGRFGKEYDECDDLERKRRWNTHHGRGLEKIFEVRRIHNDLTFIDEFLTLDFCREHKLFSFGYNPSADQYEIESRAFPEIKRRLLFNLTNLGRPIIRVVDGNYKNRGELFLEHDYQGIELETNWARDTLVNLHRLWTRPVHVATVVNNERVALSFDGQEQKSEKLGAAAAN